MNSLDEVREALSDNNMMIACYIEKIEIENEGLKAERDIHKSQLANQKKEQDSLSEEKRELQVEVSRLKGYLNWLDKSDMPEVGYDEWCVDFFWEYKGDQYEYIR